MKFRLIVSKIIAAILMFSMIIAINDQDYYYYILLRERVLFYGLLLGVLLLIDQKNVKNFGEVLLGVIISIIIWNPINPLTLDREIWSLLNIVFGLFYGYIVVGYGNEMFMDK